MKLKKEASEFLTVELFQEVMQLRIREAPNIMHRSAKGLRTSGDETLSHNSSKSEGDEI